MAPAPTTPRRTARGRPRGRPKGSGSASASRSKRTVADGAATEPPPKRRRYIPGGPGGGGRFVDEDGTEIPPELLGPSTTASRPRASAAAQAQAQPTPSAFPRRERSTRIRTAVNRDERDDMQYSSAAAVAAAVVQSEGYKPREERGWEEFHPNLDIEATFMVYQADEVDGVIKSAPPTPAAQVPAMSLNGTGTGTPTKEASQEAANDVAGTPSGKGKSLLLGVPLADTPSRRRLSRPARESFSLYATRTLDFGAGPKVPKVLPISGQTAKERLDLKQPQYRKTNRIALFESKTFGQARYVDKSMMNVGYQESDNFIRPDRNLIKAIEANIEEEVEQAGAAKSDGDAVQHPAGVVGRVEYDMDEQDDMWLEKLNSQRKSSDLDPITREIFEIAITKIEKEWYALEKRIPKPNPKPPQTHRPRSSSAAAVNGEPQAGEEQDSKCAICDDGDCENTNAIVFCDGCDLAVHQECYGVPFIPEGQWLCRKCQLIGRGIPTCIFCPNTDGAFKQTNSSKWAHLLCAMWIPEVSLGNHTFMEPVMEVEKVPKTRWRLTCYICSQRMGACIQCSNKNCYQAFHVTCARRCRLFLKMKNSQGALAVLDGTLPLKAFCDKHCPPDYAEENDVAQATKAAKRFYKRTMKNRIWADSQASALQLAATHRNAITEHPPDESQVTGAKVSAVLADKKKGQPAKNIWKLPSGAPIIPQAVYELVESALARFPIRKRKDFVGEACKYWTLKREARRGAALLKRLQLQMETFSSMELTRRNFAAMGPSGRARLDRRIDFCRNLVDELAKLKELCELVEQREAMKLELAEIEADFVDTCYFPIHKELRPILDKAFVLDKNVFKQGFEELQARMDRRYYVTTLPFARDLCQAINVGINNPLAPATQEPRVDVEASPSKYSNYSETASRKRLGKRMLKLLQPYLEAALKAEAEVCRTAYEPLQNELEGILEASVEPRQPPVSSIIVSRDEGITPGHSQEIDMADAPVEGQIIVADHSEGEEDAEGELDDAMDGTQPGEDNIEVSYYDEPTPKPSGVFSAAHSVSGEQEHEDSTPHLTNGSIKPSNSPPSLPGASYTHLSANNSKPNNHPPGAGPLTPPQSNTGSASFTAAATTNPLITVTAANNNSNTHNPLTDGGILWYLADFQLRGTTAVDPDSDSDMDVDADGEGDVDGDDNGLLNNHHHHHHLVTHHRHNNTNTNNEEKQGQDGTQSQNHQTQKKQSVVKHHHHPGTGPGPGWSTDTNTNSGNGREAVLRGLSEELTDMDEEALRDLEFDVDEEMTITIAGDGGGELPGGSVLDDHGDGLLDGDGDDDGDGAGEVDGEGEDGVDGVDGDGGSRNLNLDLNGGEVGMGMLAGSAVRKVQQQAGGGLGGSPRKRTRSEVAKAAVNGGRSLRKGVRSSARRK